MSTVLTEIRGATLARAHARSTDPAVLSGYLGRKDTFDEAMVEFARLYADQGERDYLLLQAAVKKHRITAAKGSAAALALATTRALTKSRKAFERRLLDDTTYHFRAVGENSMLKRVSAKKMNRTSLRLQHKT